MKRILIKYRTDNILPDKLINFLFFIILFIGLILRFYYYINSIDLWEDEAHLALNFMHRGYVGLMKPLENFQSAPIFFLWSVETSSRLFGFGELALKAVPFIISILSFPLFYFFVRDITKDKIAALITFLLFAINASFIHYASELKPYTVDVSAYILLGFLLFTPLAFVQRYRIALLASLGSLLILYANCSVIVLFCSGLFIITQWFAQKQNNGLQSAFMNKKGLIILIVWTTVFLINFFSFQYQHPYAAGMKEIWSWTFCPKNIFSEDFTIFMNSRIEDTLFSALLFFNKGLCFVFFLYLFFILAIANIIITKRYSILLFTLLPVLLHLLLSMFKLYPFFSRFILYLMPGLLLLFSYGIATVLRLMNRKLIILAGLPLLCFFVYNASIKSIEGYSKMRHKISPVIEFINNHYPKTPIVVTTPFTLYRYYAERGLAKNNNFEPIDWNLSPEEYYYKSLIQKYSKNYVLLYSVGGYADGYANVIADLKKNRLVEHQFEYSTYGVMEVIPNSALNDNVIQRIDYLIFNGKKSFVQGSDTLIPLWENTPLIHKIKLAPGNYKLKLIANGDAVKGVFPHLEIKMKDKLIGDCSLSKNRIPYLFDFSVDQAFEGELSIAMDNDEQANGEDRNVFIQSIFIINRN